MVQSGKTQDEDSSNKLRGLGSGFRKALASNQRLAIGLSALLLVAVVPASAATINSHFVDHPKNTNSELDSHAGHVEDVATPAENDTRIRANTKHGGNVDNESSMQSQIRTDTDVRVNGQAVPLSEDGSFSQTIETKEGHTNIGIDV